MLPLIQPCAVVILDREGVATLNRLFFGDGNLILIPENREERPQVLRLNKGESPEDFIVGRVIWIGRQMV